MAQRCAGVVNYRWHIAHQFQSLKFGAWAFSPPQALSVCYFFFPAAWFSHLWYSRGSRRPWRLCSEVAYQDLASTTRVPGVAFCPKNFCISSSSSGWAAGFLGVSRFFSCSGVHFTSEPSCLDPYILSVIFLDFAPFWVTPMWTACLALEFPWLLGCISQIMHSLWLIDQFFIFSPVLCTLSSEIS